VNEFRYLGYWGDVRGVTIAVLIYHDILPIQLQLKDPDKDYAKAEAVKRLLNAGIAADPDALKDFVKAGALPLPEKPV
jgi:hypothetical protein